MKKTFSSHIEDGLTFLGNGIHRAVMEAKDHELETIKLRVKLVKLAELFPTQ